MVDDGSEDDLEAALQSFGDVILLQQPHQGVSAARNLGIRHARSNWIALLDSDDEWLPDKLQCQQACILAHEDIRVVHTDEIWIRNGVRVNPGKRHRKSGGWIFRHCLPLCAMSPSSIVIHRDVLEAVGGFDESLPACEDYDLWLRITSRFPVEYLDIPLIRKYGGHADQLSRQFWGMDRFRIRALEKVICSGQLSPEDRQAACEMLQSKCRVYMQGLKKRGRDEEWKHYQALLDRVL